LSADCPAAARPPPPAQPGASRICAPCPTPWAGRTSRRPSLRTARLLIEYADGSIMIVDFVVPTRDEALKLIAEGATIRLDLLEQAEAEAALKRIEAASSRSHQV